MDERSILILTDKGDQTTDIADYNFIENQVHIQFKNNTKIYKYSLKKVTIKQNPKVLDISNQNVCYQNMPLRKVQEILDFEGTFKVFFQNGKTNIYDSSSIRIESKDSSQGRVLNVLNYWADIAHYTKIEDKAEAFLKKEFDKIHPIHPDSVLKAYINQAPLTQVASSTIPVIFPFRFNLSQKQALEQALTSQISIIEGPPGTGKTQTILNIIANLAIMRNKSVAVVSSNNAAVQNVKDKLQKSGYDFIAASLGNMKNRRSFFQKLPEYNVAGWKSEIQEEKIIESISNITKRLNHLLELANNKAKIDQELAAYHLEQRHFQVHYNKHNIEEMERLFLCRQTPERIISFLADEYFVGERADHFLHKAKLLFKYGFTDFKKLKDNRLELISGLQMKYYDSKIAELERKKDEIQLELDQESFEELLDQHEAYSSALFKHKLHYKYHDKEPFAGHEKNYKEMFDVFIDHFPVLLSTTHSLRSCVRDNYLFDYVIVDESSQVDLLTGVLALSCCKQAIIVGDTKQLPQIVDNNIKSKLNTDNIDDVYNYFKHSILSSLLSVYGDSIPKVILKEHYRCHPKIIGFCNNQYYDDKLIPFTLEKDNDIPLRLHYTAPGNHMRKVTLKGKEGSYNHREIDAFNEEILKELQLGEISNEEIGFTTPYRLQVEEAGRMSEKNIEIDTVHKYQGREKPVMILSTVLDQTKNGKIGRKFVENSCLVNVAVSRAQKQFILVTDYALFRNSRKDIGNLIRYIEYNTLHEHITNSELVSVFDLLYTEYSTKLNYLQNRLISKFRYKSENIMWRVLTDLLKKEQYKSVTFGTQIFLKDLLNDTKRLNEAEKRFVKNNASVDFVIYDVLNKQPLLIIEVDGFFHRNKEDQIGRDKKKDTILKKYELPLLRLPTTGSDEEKKISLQLDQILYNNIDNPSSLS
ncbi:DUF2726 domain-containing protein [Brevibacillus laterosporus]|nr:AAA domain-containing protein [Brevibacillus laterosporus]TPG71139.1 DUF2726 domain-containing protein [Brevibacillus laterosporus]